MDGGGVCVARVDKFHKLAIRKIDRNQKLEFICVKGYEAYASGEGSGTAIKIDDGRRKVGIGSAYDKSNLLVGTPEVILERIRVGQLASSFSEINACSKRQRVMWQRLNVDG